MKRETTICLTLFVGFVCVELFGPFVFAGDLMPVRQRFFRMGDGQIHIRNAHNGREANVRLLRKDGSIDEQARSDLDRIFGVPDDNKGEHISLRLLFLLDYFSDKVAPGRMVELYSGYRAPEYNRKLRAAGRIAALTSTHIDAMAIDFAIRGFTGKDLWETIRREDCCGVGHYGGKMVHLDCGRPRFWETATSKVGSGESQYNRRIYLSTEYDRYRAGEEIRLELSSVSDYPFGVKRTVRFVGEGSGVTEAVIAAEIETDSECVPIRDRSDGKSLHVRLPQVLSPGKYRVGIDFCGKPFPQMPSIILSNVIEVAGSDEPRDAEGRVGKPREYESFNKK